GGRGRRRSAGAVRALRWLAGWLLVPDAYRPWSLLAGRRSERLLRSGGFSAVWTTSSPDSVHLAGRALRRRFGLPWIADFRDPWVERLSFRPPTPLHRRVHERLERAVIREADAVVVTSDATRHDLLERYRHIDPGKVTVITNGYDEEDFRDFRWELPADRFRILHMGQLNPERSLEPLLGPVSRLLRTAPQLRGKIEIACVGPHYMSHRDEVRAARLDDVTRFHPPCSHDSAVERLGRAHLLLLLEQSGERGRLILPGKLFEYLRSGRPILALVDPRSDAARLVRERDAGWAFAPAEAAGIEQCLRDRLEAFLRGRMETGAPREALDDVERRRLAGRLAALLDRLSS
ncbi:MAG: glycosyltransferase, partial [Candidatus Eisenbacteria bacterium]|nr:glycosyltransferase [Candidatus Eisenbacteria bacterium]